MKRLLLCLSVLVVLILGSVRLGAQSTPNCRPINSSVNTDNISRIYVREIVSNWTSVTFPVVIRLTNEWGAVVYQKTNLRSTDFIELDACRYLDNQLRIHVENGDGGCNSALTFRLPRRNIMKSNFDTTVWCGDPILLRDPNDLNDLDWYNTHKWPYTWLPTVDLVCGTDKVFPRDRVPRSRSEVRDWYAPKFEECSYRATDWDFSYQCFGDQDTAKLILREWESYDKDGNRSFVYDTIVVIRLPKITYDNIYAPQTDTVECEIISDTVRDIGLEYIYWKQIVGLHSGGTLLYYPADEVSAIIDSAVTDRAKQILREKDVLRRSLTVTFSIFDVALWPTRIGPDGKLSHYVEVKKGDQVLSVNGDYLTVTDQWFFNAGAHGFYVDLALPRLVIQTRVVQCDAWSPQDCEFGIQIILPNAPYSESGCRLFCIDDNDVLAQSKCRIGVSHKDLDTLPFCPRMIKRHYSVVQNCFATNLGAVSDDCMLRSDTTGLTSYQDDSKQVKLDIAQWVVYRDNIGPLLLDVKGSRYYQANDDECFADVRVPAISAKDLCSGVKSVKATVQGEGFAILSKGDDGCWHHMERSRPFRLPCGGPYTVVYELLDSCHNVSRHNVSIFVKDNVPPTVVLDYRLRVSLTDRKIVWTDVEALDEGSTDNCEVRFMLARRKDWMESCQVDICSEEVAKLKTYTQLRNFVDKGGVRNVLAQSDVENHYARAYDWLKNDGDWCEGLENFVVQGWEDEMLNYWAEYCLPKDEHGLSPIDTYEGYAGIGGGWSEAVPFCCEDACKSIAVEVLVVDKECNFSRGWLSVEVEDKSTVSRAKSFDELQISCQKYQSLYAETINNAVSAGNSSKRAPEEFELVDDILGGIGKGWRGPNDQLVDDQNIPIPMEVEYQSSYCDYVVNKVQVLEQLHDGSFLRKWVDDTSVVIRDTTITASLGGAFIRCGVQCEQDIWTNLNDCGTGTIIRRWKVLGGCAQGTSATPIEFEQRINVVANCRLESGMFEWPKDTTVCLSGIPFDGEGNVDINLGDPEYLLDDEECRKLGINKRDAVFAVQGSPHLTKVERTWFVNEWCEGTNIAYTQKIILDASCDDDDDGTFTLSGTITYLDTEQGVMNALVTVDPLSDAQTQSLNTDEDGRFSFQVDRGSRARVEVLKDTYHLNGVNIFDLLTIQRHILGQSPLRDSKRLIAADVNRDGRINGLDLINIQQLTFDRIQGFPNNKSWRFFDVISGEETLEISDISGDRSFNFYGVKIGDVDGRNVDPSRGSGIFHPVRVQPWTASSEADLYGAGHYRLSISSKDIVGGQLRIAIDPASARILQIKSNLPYDEAWNWNEAANTVELFGVLDELAIPNQEIVFELWTENAENSQVALDRLFQVASLNQEPSILVTEEGDVRSPRIVVDDISLADDMGRIELHQNTPNPVTNGYTTIGLYLPREMSGQLEVYDISGRMVYSEAGRYSAGLTTIGVNTYELGGEGVYIYIFTTELGVLTRRMVVLEP